jgi:hypothetical protein
MDLLPFILIQNKTDKIKFLNSRWENKLFLIGE